MAESYFPFDLFELEPFRKTGSPAARLLEDLAPLSMSPPMPWGQWLYARLIRERCVNLKGDFIECGVGEGGMSLFLGHLAQEQGRRLYALDSFSGLPKPNPVMDNPYFRKGDYAGNIARGSLFGRFKKHIRQSGLRGTIAPLKGFFSHALPRLPGGAVFSFAHIDADLHSSVLECLKAIYPRLVEGGILVVDDFFHHAQGPARAVAEYFSSLGQEPLLHVAFPYSVVLIKGEKPPAGLHRALDGNRYSLRFLKEDKLFCDVVEKSFTRAGAAHQTTAVQNARRLLKLLQGATPETSGDVYEYWRALGEYWDHMDADRPQSRKAIKI